MRYSAAKWILTAVFSTASLALVSTDANACCGLFGWGAGYGYRSNYYGYYGPSWGGCGPYGCGTSYYAPVAYSGCSTCGPVCSPCGPCATCAPCGGVGCAPCAGGNCAAGGCSSIPNDQWQKKSTYDQGDTGAGTGDASGGNRTKSETDGAGTSGNSQDGDFQPVNRAGGTSAGGTSGGSTSSGSKAGNKGPNPQKIDDDQNGARKAPTINIDEKVAWRSPPTRTRVESRPHVGNARLVRLTAYPQSEWLPADGEAKIAGRK